MIPLDLLAVNGDMFPPPGDSQEAPSGPAAARSSSSASSAVDLQSEVCHKRAEEAMIGSVAAAL